MAATNIQSFSGDVEVASNLSVDTNTLHVDSVAGRVGIGKTDPGFALDVSGTVNATALYVGGSEFVSGLWTSNASNAYYTTGAVGIGTDFPKKDLEVQGTLRLSNAVTGDSTDLVVVPGDGTWDYQTKITAPDAQLNDDFGVGVSISGDGSYAIVGAMGEDPGGTPNAGAAYIYSRSGSSWDAGTKITAPDAQASDFFGYSVSISGDGLYAIVGAYREDAGGTSAGAAYIYARSGSTWNYQAKITAPDAQAYDQFGYSVSISGDGLYAIVGAYEEDPGGTPSAGAAYIYSRSGSSWDAGTKITAPDAQLNDQFGFSVSISGDGSYAIVGARLESAGGTPYTGSAYIYSRSGSTWDAGTKITAPDAGPSDQFGFSVSISGDGLYAIVGARLKSAGGTPGAGSAYIYARSGSSWDAGTKITAPDAQAGDYFGQSVSISGDGSYAIVGAWLEHPGGTPDAGAAYIYSRSGSSWGYQAKITAPDAWPVDYFGNSVSISGDGSYAIVGARREDPGGIADAGAAYIYNQDLTRLSTTTPIEAAGTILSFTGQHTCFPEGPMSQGMVVSANKNKYVTLNGPLITGARAIKSSESLPVVSLSNVANDRSAFGVVDHFENGGTSRTQTSGATVVHSDKEMGDNRVIVNSLGEGAMWVANTNGPLESGDYITTSNIAGYGQRQEDKKLHSYTVAKITMDCDFEPEDVPIQVIKKDENGQNVLDNYGRIQWEEVPDQTEKEYRIRYLTTDGRQTDQANAVWKAAYVGCTYHCG